VICGEARELAHELACDRVKNASLLLEALQIKKTPAGPDPPSRSWLNGALEPIGLRIVAPQELEPIAGCLTKVRCTRKRWSSDVRSSTAGF
jgi:hypothetical protein